ncbi:Hypothetical predicted protein [Paramuricea clavata]|uniref:Uncharacterized protein n=1 Tax=Paramuricea clavata TaxID=317549 RepID=A0A7D9JH60_PARCT|nr:Hypothetical predicted protein [Paramuricea clavata]
MYSGVVMRQKTKQETCAEEHDSFHDKRRLLSYWKSLDSSSCPVNNETGNDVKNELLAELRKCLTELDDLDSLSNTTEQDVSSLQNEQLSLLKQLGEYSAYFTPGTLDLNDNLNSNNKAIDALRAERKLLLEENEKLVKQMEKQKKEYKSSSGEQQNDIEKLTREVQNFNISRRKLERELLQITKQKNENEATINSLRQDMKAMKDSHEAEMKRLSNVNDQVSQDNSELVEKGKEATESLKIALHQLTEEKKAMQGQKKTSSGKDIREIEAPLERAKKEREAFRQRCEKSEILQRTLQEEISSLKKEVEVKEKQLSRRSYREVVDGGDVTSSVGEKSTSEDGDEGLQGGQSRISQLKKHGHILEERIKEKHETILSLRKENARANDIAMEKSLELSRTRRILERKIEKLTNENYELKKKFLIPSSSCIRNKNTGNKQESQKQLELKQRERNDEEVLERRQRRRSNPERWAIDATLKRLNNENPSSDTYNDTSTGTISKLKGNQVEKPDNQDSGRSTLNVPLDVTPRRRIGGKFIRASSKRHSADLGKLMSRPEPVINKKSESDMLLEDEPATIFINKYRKKSEEEEHWV